MSRENFETPNIICIVTNEGGSIKYSNIDDEIACACLQKLNNTNSNMRMDCKNYCACTDSFYIHNHPYYITIMASEHNKCDDCSRVLIDAVTGLYNRNYWEQFHKGKDKCLGEEKFSLIFIDADNLKEINDKFGHLTGDEAIKIVGGSIKSSIREEDVGIRYGGDEFIVLLADVNEAITRKIARRIKAELYRRRTEKGIDVHVSMGVVCGGSLNNVDQMIAMADKDLYREKQRKKKKNQDAIKTLQETRVAIEKVRNELDRKLKDNNGISNRDILALRKELEKLME